MEFLWNLYGIRMVHQARFALAAGWQPATNTLKQRRSEDGKADRPVICGLYNGTREEQKWP